MKRSTAQKIMAIFLSLLFVATILLVLLAALPLGHAAAQPVTGDTTNVWWIIVIMAVAAIAIAFAVFYMLRKKAGKYKKRL